MPQLVSRLLLGHRCSQLRINHQLAPIASLTYQALLILQPDSEESNEMVFCDQCNICVHQVSLKKKRVTPVATVD